MITKTFLGLFFAALTLGAPIVEAAGNPELTAVLSNSLSKLDREASMDSEGFILLTDLLVKEFATRADELTWSMDQKMSGGEIAACAYIQATTGKSFTQMN